MPETKNKKHFLPRPDQQKALEYKGGEMGISAVPGSGKTHTLSALAANLVEKLLMSQQGDYDPKKRDSHRDIFELSCGEFFKTDL